VLGALEPLSEAGNTLQCLRCSTSPASILAQARDQVGVFNLREGSYAMLGDAENEDLATDVHDAQELRGPERYLREHRDSTAAHLAHVCRCTFEKIGEAENKRKNNQEGYKRLDGRRGQIVDWSGIRGNVGLAFEEAGGSA
jgi:hypothetical protein